MLLVLVFNTVFYDTAQTIKATFFTHMTVRQEN